VNEELRDLLTKAIDELVAVFDPLAQCATSPLALYERLFSPQPVGR
jgi:hypothetical protein